ncbi:MAG: Gfo/Idh/MocA family oxidoreductase [Bryobacterales bacterium]|nr:Gfo/Idh/MocA family oxidoreductase [Bryobacterales bacterium]
MDTRAGAIVRWGVVGCGGIAARRTIPEVTRCAANARICAVMDVRADVACEVASRFGIESVCRTEEELLAKDIDAVYIATPPHLHAAQVARAAGAGKHVLCEKPLVLTVEEAHAIAAAATRSAVRIMPAYCMRFHSQHARARATLQSGRWGPLVLARAQLTCWYPPMAGAWRQNLALGGGGSFIDMGTHCLDLIEWISGEHVVEVCGMQGQRVQRYGDLVEDVSAVLVRLSGGAQGMIDNCFCVPDAASRNRLELYCAAGAFLAEGTIGQESCGSSTAIFHPQERYDAQQARSEEPLIERYDARGKGLYAEMVGAFSAAILEGAPAPIPLADGVRLLRAVRAVYLSVEQGRTVRLDEV